ncbi:MAG: hypothetical protein A2527_07380 [Candidatus Lambdaproteobacteria bacterium RIFOXYD2_FULL_50_16]|uniref:Probable cytosol aminopeptidase n=1 Tax=Candidatus Lambdaproteobacteria bacterium RIFOXYD2_FULL_50_16 TaxID=1817772 RepID=A0A1F6GB51_9PROT|nr:MAG: hypothetical protein A2527_07380 [Candidatus Lambdaproteobacteria bacterium RIFOXYD2_FULL_50_16]
MKIRFTKPKVQPNLVLFFDAKKHLALPNDWPTDLTEELTQLLKLPEFGAKSAVYKILHPRLERVFLVGLGKKPEPRELGALLGKELINPDFAELHLLLPEDQEHPILTGFGPFLEGFFLGQYQYEEYKTDDTKKNKFKRLTILGSRKKSLGEALDRAWVMAEGTRLTRDLGNRPANKLTPSDLSLAAQSMSQAYGLKYKRLTEAQMGKLGMGCLLGVSKGSDQPAFLNVIEYQGDKGAPTLMWVGKGLTFDAGGISLKPAANMHEMKHDMCGGAAVIGAMQIIAELKPKINIIALIPTSENLPDGKANKPGDVLTAFNGKTVEILNTDAEGRLILADALSWGVKEYKPDWVIDIATLTGACVVALGHYHSGLQSDSEPLAKRIEKAAQVTGDPVWRMPHAEIYEKDIQGTISDLKNAGGPHGGMITAGLFLKQFVGKTPWAHLDIAGTAWSAERIPYYPKSGATGVGARLLAEIALSWET